MVLRIRQAVPRLLRAAVRLVPGRCVPCLAVLAVAADVDQAVTRRDEIVELGLVLRENEIVARLLGALVWQDWKAGADLDVVDVRRDPVAPLLVADVVGELGA